LAADPADRYPSAAAVAAALAPFAGQTRKGRLDRRAWVVVVAAALAVAVAVLGVLQPWRARGATPAPTEDPPGRPAEAKPPGVPVGRLPMTPEEARALQVAWAKEAGRPVVVENGIGMTCALIPPGEFGLSTQCRVRLTR